MNRTTAERAGPVRRFLHKRPFALFAALYALGAAVGAASHVPAPLWGGAMIAAGGWYFIRRRFVALFAAALFIGAWGAAALSALEGPAPAMGVTLIGRVSGAPKVEAARVVFPVDQVTLDGRRAGTPVRVYHYVTDAPVPLQIDDIVEATVETWRAQGVRNPGGFDFSAYLKRQGIYLCATTAKDTLIVRGGAGFSPGLWLERVRDALSQRIDALFPEHAALARSILLGDRRDLDEEAVRAFQTAGVTHLLSVSGLHVTCMATALAWLLVRMRVKRRTAYWITLPLIALYTLLVGLPASAVRAALMFALVGGARLPGRPYDPLTGLTVSLMILLAANPLMIYDLGLILSFLAVLGILLLEPVIRGLFPPLHERKAFRYAVDGLSLSASAQLATLPVTCSAFGVITPYALLTNLPAVPLCTLALPLIMAAVLLSYLWPPLAHIAAWLPGLLLKLLNGLTVLASRWPFATVYAPAWPWWLMAAFAALIFPVSPLSRFPEQVRRRLLPGFLALAALSFALAYVQRPSGLAVTVLDAGQADAAVVRCEGALYLADVGHVGSPADDYVRHTGQAVEAVFLTHPHVDHAGGLKELLSIRHVPVIYLPESWHRVEADREVLEAVALAVERGAEIRYLAAGDALTLSENVTVTVLSPQRGATSKDGNAASLLLAFQYGASTALITGDLPSSAEPYDLTETTLLKVAHHGSANSSSNYFLRATRPLAAVISVGRNGYGHPTEAVLERLAAAGAATYRTDHAGAVTAFLNLDGTMEMETYICP